MFRVKYNSRNRIAPPPPAKQVPRKQKSRLLGTLSSTRGETCGEHMVRQIVQSAMHAARAIMLWINLARSALRGCR